MTAHCTPVCVGPPTPYRPGGHRARRPTRIRRASAGLALVRLQHEPEIVLTWLVRLRWLAGGGTDPRDHRRPLAVRARHRVVADRVRHRADDRVEPAARSADALRADARRRAWLVPAVIVLDVLLLTALLYFSGGAANPFSILYIVHIVMAVVVLGAGGRG